MKLISKQNCERCVKVKEYLKEKGVEYEEVLITNPTDLKVYRKMLVDNNRQLGFPIILNGGTIINGSYDEIIRSLDTKDNTYFWGR